MVTLNNLKILINDKKSDEILLLFEDYNVVNIAEIVANLNKNEIVYLMDLLPKNIGGDLFANLDVDNKLLIFESLEANEYEIILNHMYLDDAVVMLQMFPNVLVRKIFDNISDTLKEDITTLLNYEAETAGSIMTIEFIELKANDTFLNALDKVKDVGSIVEVVTDCYIIDSKRVLQGKIKLTDLLFKEASEIVKDNMDSNITYVNVADNQEDVLAIMQKYDLHVIPVVNDNKALVGIITIDDILDVMEKEVTKDVHLMAGITSLEDSYLNTSIVSMVKSRLPWLLTIMISVILSEFVLYRFSSQLIMLPALGAFIPMMMGMAGNAANQSSVMVIRAIVVDGLNRKDAFKVFLKEVSVSFYLSLVLIVIMFLRLYLLPPSITLDIVLSISLASVITLFLANIVGGLLPILALIFNSDPAAMAIPLVTNIMDVSSLIIYFVIVKLVLGI